MIVDKHGKSVLSKKAKRAERYAFIRDLLKKRIVLAGAFISLLAVAISNVSTFVDFYEKFTNGPHIEIPIEIKNNKAKKIVISKLLDVHITNSPFFVGRLMVEEQPTDRVLLNPVEKSDSYSIPAGKTLRYSIRLSERRYKHELASGAANAVFVLRLENSGRFYYLDEKFHKGTLGSVIFTFSLE